MIINCGLLLFTVSINLLLGKTLHCVPKNYYFFFNCQLVKKVTPAFSVSVYATDNIGFFFFDYNLQL